MGKNNQLPWHLPADLKHFKTLTLGKPVIMGRKTYESMGKPLSGRTNIILTRALDFHAEDCIIVHSLDEAIKATAPAEEIFIIGGAELFRQSLNCIQRIYLTVVHAAIDADTFFPKLDSSWVLMSEEYHVKDEKNEYDYSFLMFERGKE